jgi:hypothetical protein
MKQTRQLAPQLILFNLPETQRDQYIWGNFLLKTRQCLWWLGFHNRTICTISYCGKSMASGHNRSKQILKSAVR